MSFLYVYVVDPYNFAVGLYFEGVYKDIFSFILKLS